MPPDFLNSREDAILLWTVVILGFVLYKDFRGIGGAFLGVIRSILHPTLLRLFGSVLAYSAAIVYAASAAGLWHVSALKATIYWFAGTALVLAGGAVTDGARDDRAFLRKVLRRVVAVTVLTEFVVNVYSLPFAIEIVCVLVLFAFAGMQAFVQHDESQPQAVRTFIDTVLAAVGLLYFGYFALRALSDLSGFLSRENAEDFLVGPALTITLVPMLLIWAWASRQQQPRIRRRLDAAHDTPG
jgi:hypothetical protein